MKEVTWRFIDTGANDAATNMAMDEAILTAHSLGLVPPTIRFYTWQPATLTVGYFQKLMDEIDVEAVQRYGYQLVRRLTGGRAVLHDDELTYSVIISEEQMPTSVIEAYRLITTALLEGYKGLGLNAEYALPEKKGQPLEHSAVCFETPSAYEVVVEGRKVAGSAQTRQKGVVLQHGSIPLTMNVDTLYDLFYFPNERIKERLKRAFHNKSIAINELLAEPVSIEQVKNAFASGFERAFQTSLKPTHLTSEELELTKKFVTEKYSSHEWVYRR